MKKIYLLTSNGPQGHDLAEQLATLAQRLSFEIVPIFGFTQSDFISGYIAKRLQIIDLSMDEDPLVYDKAHPVHTSRHLYISRTHTPLNFRPTSVAIRDSEDQINSFPEFGETNTNHVICRWLSHRLPEFMRQSQFFIPIIGRLLDMKKDAAKRKNDIQKSGSIFLSYRSSENQNISALAKQIEKASQKQCRYFAPGVISREAMSRMRRWNLLSLLDRYILSAEEIWTCLSEDYFYSWWTFGEFLVSVHRQTKNGTGHKPIIKKYRNGTLETWAEAEWPSISEAQHKRISKYFAFCDSFQMGPEALISHESIQNLKLQFAESYYQDEVWEKEFWLNPIIECQACRQRSLPYNQIPIEQFLWHGTPTDQKNPQEAIIHRGNGIMELSYDALPALLDTGVTCSCGHTTKLRKGPMQYVHVFLPPKDQTPFSAAHELARKWGLPEASVIGNNLLALQSFLIDHQ